MYIFLLFFNEKIQSLDSEEEVNDPLIRAQLRKEKNLTPISLFITHMKNDFKAITDGILPI